MRKLLFLAPLLALALAAGQTWAAEKLRVGASPTPHAEILAEAARVLAPAGIELEIVEYSDYVQPNVALDAKDLDANYFQHKPYLDDFVIQKGVKLASMGPVHYEPFGIYAGKTKDLAKLPKGAIIAVPNDATNEGRALLLLQDKGLIKLRPDAGLAATTHDIIDNPLNLRIEEIEAPQLVRALPDVDAAVVNGNYAILGGLKVADALAVEAADSMAAATYANVLAVRDADMARSDLKLLYDALTGEKIAKFMQDKYAGAVLPAASH
ncbi:MAG: metal ABC transporter substrate-binding protein [Desulfovibrio sp.]|nr:metal ABC transporter substrate-binding protein [Desulfovibrio sp.]